MAALNPGMASLVSKRSGKHSGAALGLQSSDNSLGQVAGPLVGSILFTWNIHLPYLLTAVPLIITAIIMGRKYPGRKTGRLREGRRKVRFTISQNENETA